MIADNYLQLRSEVETALGELLKLASATGGEDSPLDTVRALLTDVREPLLFVVVGEVKAGKSSLLNALFGRDLAKVDVLPATDRVYIFKYGETEKMIDVSPQLTERYEPVEFLRDFNIVDTPGTNTMVAEHQQITEQFVPRADVVLFVFSVVNPWSQSAWELLNFVQKKWLKHVVFVLQQADLRDDAEIDTIVRHLQQTAVQRLGFTPPIFPVSARKALSARNAAADAEQLWNESRFAPLEEQINRTVTDAGERLLKLQSTGRTALVVLNEITDEIRASYETVLRDEEQLTRLRDFLGARKDQTLRQVAGFVRGVEQACRQCAAAGTRLLEEKLSFWRTWRLVWARAQWQRNFQIEIETQLRQTIQPQIENAVQLLESDLRALWPHLRENFDAQFDSTGRAKLGHLAPDFARQRRELLQAVQLTLAERVAGRGMEEQLEQIFRETSTWLRLPAGVAAAGGIVTIVAAMSSAAVADVTGVIAASAAVIGTVVAFSQRRKILGAYEKEMERKRIELTHAIEGQMQHAIELFYKEISVAFEPLVAFCTTERQRYEPLMQQAENAKAAFAAVSGRLSQPE
jgi:small GTP-binding protein